MEIHTTTRHCELDQEVRLHAQQRLEKLGKFARDIRKKLPIDPIQKLKTQLEKAVQREAYEDAARIRDEIRRKTEEVE